MVIQHQPIIVTGGGGFIGGHLVSRLLQLGEKVVVIDREINTLDRRAMVIRMDIGNRGEVAKVVSRFPQSFIFHLAAETIVSECYERPWETMQTNIMGTVNFLEAARMTGSVKGMIVASSDKAYGKTKTAYSESTPLAGDHPYDVSKSSADLITQAYIKTYNLPVVVTRFGNVYGEGDAHMDRIIPGICRAIVNNEELIIRSDGTYVRDYVYVDDVVEGYMLLWKKLKLTCGQVYNFSSKDTYSVMEVLKLAEKVLGTRIKYTLAKTAKNEIPYQHLNDAKVRKLGWKNQFRLNDILPHVYEWYKKYL